MRIYLNICVLRAKRRAKEREINTRLNKNFKNYKATLSG